MTDPWTGRLVRKNPHLVAILCSSQIAQPSWYIYLHIYGKCRYILDPSWVLYSIYFQFQSLNESVRSRLRETSRETPSQISIPQIAAQTPNSWKHDNIIHREPPKKFLTSGWLSPPFSRKKNLNCIISPSIGQLVGAQPLAHLLGPFSGKNNAHPGCSLKLITI